MHAAHERRRKEPSYTMPLLFEALEVVLIWIVFGIVESTFDVTQWGFASYGLASLWLLYTAYKLMKVLKRQATYKW